MYKTAPHYLLFTEAKISSHSNGLGNRWRFVLEEIGTSNRFEEADEEPGVQGERLQLLAVVRGLEALDQPSRVTLVTPSKHVGRGIRRSLTQWRDNDWQWERFGAMTPVKDHDLWKRIDHAMQIHQINCRVWQFDPPHLRTQVPQESDQDEMVRPRSKFVSPISQSAGQLETIPARLATAVDSEDCKPIQSHKLTIGQARPAIERTLDQFSRVADVVEKKVRPIGQGRAYGYAIN